MHQLNPTTTIDNQLRRSTGSVDVDQANKMKVSYVASFWEEIGSHRKEVKAALFANLHNPHIDQVVVFFDKKDNVGTCRDFRKDMIDLSQKIFGMAEEDYNELLAHKLYCVDVKTGEPTFHQMFQNALSDVVTGDVVVLSTGDMVFDETLSLARYLNPEVLLVLGTSGFTNKITPYIRYVYEKMIGTKYVTTNPKQDSWENNRCHDSKYSWDTFIFHKKKLQNKLRKDDFKRLNQNNEMVYFYHNESGAMGAALWAVEQSYSFSSTYNACDRIHSWHFHLTPSTVKDREIPWLAVKDHDSPMFTPRGSVPKPWGGFYGLYPHPYARKDPDCVRTGNCFLDNE